MSQWKSIKRSFFVQKLSQCFDILYLCFVIALIHIFWENDLTHKMLQNHSVYHECHMKSSIIFNKEQLFGLPLRCRHFTLPPTHTPCWERDREKGKKQEVWGKGANAHSHTYTHTHTQQIFGSSSSPSTLPSFVSTRSLYPCRTHQGSLLDARAWIMNFIQFTATADGDMVS